MLEKKLHTLLVTVCPRVWPGVAPVSTPRPYVTWSEFGGQALEYLENTRPDLRNAFVQINVWSSDPQEAIALMLQIDNVLRNASTLLVRPQAAAQTDYDPDMLVHGARQDFSVWDDFSIT